jgi:Protein of unknown function (DUF3011)
MFTTRNWVGLVLVLTALMVFGPRCKAQVTSCSSDDGGRHSCPLDVQGRVRIVQQRSESQCQEGYSWGYDDRSVWVDHGCRADFVVDPYRETEPSTVSCSSDDGRRHYCPVDVPGRIRLAQQRSESACREGYSWGADGRSIWVDHGCRADFVVEPHREREPVTVSCSSDDGRRHYCAVDTRGRVRLAQQRSESPCREGHSWGANNKGIWVDHGCRADFVIEGRRWDHDRDHDWNRGDDQPAPDQIISCASDDQRRHYCPVDTRGGVRLLKQNSETPCRQGESWGFDDRGIWVDRGCRADFQVVR